MATLLHHIKPLMQRSINEEEERLKCKMVHHTEQKISEVHQRLDALELRVLASSAPQVDVSTLQAAVESLRADIYMILESRVPECKSPYADLVVDTLMASLYPTSEISPLPPREHARRCKGRKEDVAREQKKEHCEMKPTRRASLIDEEALQIRAVEYE